MKNRVEYIKYGGSAQGFSIQKIPVTGIKPRYSQAFWETKRDEMLIDNFTEFKRSSELEGYAARTYETNYLINIAEYVEVLNQDEFAYNERPIKTILERLSENYLFNDIGYSYKNSYNWGKRPAHLTDEELEIYGENADLLYDVVILDYGYMYPLYDQKDKLYRCPKCQHRLQWLSNYTALQCTNSGCNLQLSPTEIRRRMNLSYEKLENEITNQFNNLQMPNLTSIEQSITKIGGK